MVEFTSISVAPGEQPSGASGSGDCIRNGVHECVHDRAHSRSRLGQGILAAAKSLMVATALVACSHDLTTPDAAANATPKIVEAPLGTPLSFDPDQINRAGASKTPYVILVSIDGYRYDYNSRFHPKNLEEIAKRGLSAEALLPIFPSKTFPSHYSIATGLYADHHGIVSNEFYDPARKQVYALGDRSKVEDGSWYFGEPLWITASKQGLLSASCFWVGSEADIQHRHPNYYYRYDKSVSSEERVNRVLGWLKLAPDKRPHFITLYFDIVDLAGHHGGVDDKNLPESIRIVDEALGKLREGIKSSHLPVDLIVVSDHGMENLDPAKSIAIDDIFGVVPLLSKFTIVGRGPQMMLYLKPGEKPEQVDEILRRLRLVKNHFRAFKRSELQELHYSGSERIGDIVLIPDIPYTIGLKADPPTSRGGNHGWDVTQDMPDAKNMRGILYAEGPNIKPHSHLPAIENVNIYPMITQILDLKPDPNIDGRISVTKRILRK